MLISEQVKKEMITIKNFWKMSDFSLRSVLYAYVDHNSYLADSLLKQNRVRMKFRGEMAREDSPYCIIFCKVLKADASLFEEALEKLKDKMLLLDHRDYQKVCEDVNQMIEEGTKERMLK